jgi:hypothetical protein
VVVRALIACLVIAAAQTRDTINATSAFREKMLLARHGDVGAECCLEQFNFRTAETLACFGCGTNGAMIFDQQETSVFLHFELRHIPFDGSQSG